MLPKPEIEYPADPPDGWRWALKKRWTCRLHDRPHLTDEDDPLDFPELGCSCETRARWVPVEPEEWLLESTYLLGYFEEFAKDTMAKVEWLEANIMPLSSDSVKVEWLEDNLVPEEALTDL